MGCNLGCGVKGLLLRPVYLLYLLYNLLKAAQQPLLPHSVKNGRRYVKPGVSLVGEAIRDASLPMAAVTGSLTHEVKGH